MESRGMTRRGGGGRTCAVHLVGKVHGMKKVGEVAEQQPAELLAMMQELAAALRVERGEEVPAQCLVDLVKYTESVAGAFPPSPFPPSHFSLLRLSGASDWCWACVAHVEEVCGGAEQRRDT